MNELRRSVPQRVIMISSTRADLMQYREEASRVIRKVAGDCEKRVQLVETSMEKEVQSGDRELPAAVSKRWVEEADWVVLIVGWHYGTISSDPDAKGTSVTELEFRHAVDLQKKTFAFVAGERGDTDEYCASGEERENLRNWMDKQDEEHRAKLSAFKASLASAHLAYFKNLRHFCERLESTLREHADPIGRGGPLIEILIAVGPSIQPCIDKVKVIAACKRVHDYLHELRQNVIRPILESALIQWRGDGQLGGPVRTLIENVLVLGEAKVRDIEYGKQDLGGEGGNLLAALERVISVKPTTDFPSELPDLEAFEKAVRRYSAAVQTAFTLADEAMLRHSHALEDLHLSFAENVAAARQRHRLSAVEDTTLNDLLRRVDEGKQRLIEVLDVHHGWQSQHDKLDMLNGYRRHEDFDVQFANFLENSREQLGAMVRGAAAEPGQEDADPILSRKLALLDGNLNAISETPGLSEFDSMRKTFDDIFYGIDKRTLRKVQESEQRVRYIESRLNELARQESRAA